MITFHFHSLVYWDGKHEYVNFTTPKTVEKNYAEYHVTKYPLIFL